jgi:hypothetical protein
MKYLLVILFFIAGTAAFAQTKQQGTTTAKAQDKPLVQFSGIVHNADSVNSIVPYVSITNISSNRTVYISNYQGYFSFVAHQQDTLRFTCVGFAPTMVVIPSDASLKSYTVQINLHPQIINLPTFHVFPWATTDEFKKDFLAMKIADDDLEIAKKNVSRTSLTALRSSLARDGFEIQDANYQNMNTTIMNEHSLTPNPLLNPLAWGSFINQISQGDKSRSESSGSSN